MPDTLITGGTGFVGRRLVAALAGAGGPPPRLLLRDSSRVPPEILSHASVAAGDLADAASLERATAGCDTVVHLAARTGRASREGMLEANAEGTRRLLDAATRAGVSRFVFASSIAAGFLDRRWYHYAESKRLAEDAVRHSGLDWVIVRPTMVFGAGSAVQAALGRLATAPVGICFGRGAVPVQPVHVADLARILLALLDRPRMGEVMIEVGGPDVLPLADLLRRLRMAARGRQGPMLHLPIEPLRTVLGALDRPLWRVLPFTAGQLASFVNPGVAAAAPDWLPRPAIGIDAMLAEPAHA